jgi:tRNA-dihydrouridine synthase
LAALPNGEIALPPSLTERIRVTKKHLAFSIQWKGNKLGIFEMRRHYASYFKGFPDFKPFRARLVEAMTGEEIFLILKEVEEKYIEVVLA